MTEAPTDAGSSESLSFPRQRARTLNFTLGAPRSFTVTPDGGRVLFVRSNGPMDSAGCLWAYDVEAGTERLLADPGSLLVGSDSGVPAEELARRERMREATSGITGYAIDKDGRRAVFALDGRLFAVEIADGQVNELPGSGVIDPRLSPDGRHVAFVSAGALHIVDLDDTGAANTSEARTLLEPDGANVTWGLAEFVAAEEMNRTRGHWWSPESNELLVARVDESPVREWTIADPANPDAPAHIHRYPAAGTNDAEVTLWRVDNLSGERHEVVWDRLAFPYLIEVSWSAHRPGLVQVMSRDQRTSHVLEINGTQTTQRVVLRDDHWVDQVPGTPCWWGDRVLTVRPHEGAYTLFADEAPLTDQSLQVRAVVGVDEHATLVIGQPTDAPDEQQAWSVDLTHPARQLSEGRGVHTARRGGHTTIIASNDLDHYGARFVVHSTDSEPHELASNSATPDIWPRVTITLVGERALPTALLLPSDHVPGSAQLPVLLDPYGGPHFQRVVAAARGYGESQWWADQGFAVLVTDGRGTPRNPDWERAVHYDLASLALDDQIDALHAAAAEHSDLDLSRVGIRGWSFGGYLAALAVLKRPDVFHAAVAGAPVTDMHLYDTFYTERYLGHPDEHEDAYERSSLISLAPSLQRPLMLIHGLADDNVVAAHTLRMSSALLAAGRPHTVLPLSGVTHMAVGDVVAENLLLLQRAFLREALGLD